ncbi:MAG TPA: SH3 domain-containing protein [Iamia sp.]
MRRPHAVLALTAALVLGLAACGDDGDGDEDTSAATTEATSSTTEASGSSTTAAEGSTTTAADGSTTTAPAGDLPGEPTDIYPYEGAHLGVVGVAAGDTLNVRSGPGTEFDVVAELNPLSQEPTATGQNRTLGDGSLWVEVTVGDETGWVNGAFVAEPGAVVDITDDVGDLSAPTMEALAEAVAATRVFEGEGPTPTVTIVAGPDGGAVTVDVLGLADDAQKGERLLVLGLEGADGFTAMVVESVALCARGVTDDGLCT